MALNKGKHIIEEIEEVRCSLVEKGITENRMIFLKDLLELNKYTVKIQKEETNNTYTIGVSDLTFNPLIAVYEKSIYTANGMKITPDYWLQKTTEIDPYYWELKKH